MVVFTEKYSESKVVKLPESIKQTLVLKNKSKEMSIKDTRVDSSIIKVNSDTSVELVLESQEMNGNNTFSKKVNKKKTKRGKKKKHNHNQLMSVEKFRSSEKSEVDEPEVEYVQDLPEFSDLEPMYRQFSSVFESFRFPKPEEVVKQQVVEISPKEELVKNSDVEEEEQSNQIENEAPLSRRKQKQQSRLTVAALKQIVSKPDVVEMHDVTARDPVLLVQLKSTRNSVPVPRHWCAKTKYLQRKRGIEKPPFQLPDFLRRTGITELRAIQQTAEENKTMKGKMREKVRPKMDKVNIEYDKLYDAFFKWQTKPRMSIHGDLYYEGKEFETKGLDKRPGVLSTELRNALGMPVGHNAYKVPPPFLIAMQRYGPPPSYPDLKIAGLNAPLPDGCAFGYHVGGWGKPPVDDAGRPLYGDVFGVQQIVDDTVEIDRTLWGEPESDSEEDEEEEEEEEADQEGEGTDTSGFETPVAGSAANDSEAETEKVEAPDQTIELRKKRIEKDMESNDVQSLYTVLTERKTEGLGVSMMGSTHIYDMTGAGGPAPPSVIAARRGALEDPIAVKNSIELTLDPSELDLNSEIMASKYEQTLRAQNNSKQEDMSDMLQEHLKKQKGQSKRKNTQTSDNKAVKKYKEFKF